MPENANKPKVLGALLRSQADKSDAPLNDFLRYIFEELLAR